MNTLQETSADAFPAGFDQTEEDTEVESPKEHTADRPATAAAETEAASQTSLQDRFYYWALSRL